MYRFWHYLYRAYSSDTLEEQTQNASQNVMEMYIISNDTNTFLLLNTFCAFWYIRHFWPVSGKDRSKIFGRRAKLLIPT